MASTAARLDASEVENKRNLRKVVAASFIGTTIEWYDFFLYGTAAALVFGELFFPGSSPLIGTLSAFGTFAVGFAARPLGGVVFGHFGDRIGRKAMLVTSLLIMGLATFLIGVPADARVDRHPRPDPARAAALRAGHRRRRRVGRRGPDGRRARPEGQARLLRRVAADGRPRRPAALDRRLHDDAERHHRGPVHGLGLAHPVPRLDRARRGRPLHPPGASWSRRRSRRSRTSGHGGRTSRSSTLVKRPQARRPDRDGHADRRERHASTSSPCSCSPTARRRWTCRRTRCSPA